MKEIKLTQGQVALVDDEDFEKVNQFKWHATKSNRCNSLYALCFISTNKPRLRMHRLIMNVTDNNVFVDHINRNGLDNRKSNLRLCSNAQNQINKTKHKNNTSGYKGVFYSKQHKKFRANIGYKGRKIFIGLFDTAIEAAKAYDNKSNELYGIFSCNNIKQVI